MTTKGKIALLGTGFLALFGIDAYRKRPIITVTGIDAATQTVQYTMSVNGRLANGIAKRGGQIQSLPAGDGQHFFVSEPLDDTVYFIITKSNPNGSAQVMASGEIGYAYAPEYLPYIIEAFG